MERFVIDTYGPDADAERAAFGWLLAKARELGSEAVVIVPGVSNIDGLGRVLGQTHAAYAKQHRELVIGGIRVVFFTPRTRPSSVAGPVLVLWADTSMVEAAERMNPPAICATGWSKDGLDDWKRSWAPVDPRTGQPDGKQAQASAAVQGAVASLSGPLGNDVLHLWTRGVRSTPSARCLCAVCRSTPRWCACLPSSRDGGRMLPIA